MNTTAQPPHVINRDVAISYVLVPFLLITLTGIVAAMVMYMKRKERIDRLRHQLLPVYSYDSTEELHEAEHGDLWKEEDAKVVQGWMRTYQQHQQQQHQQHQPLLSKDPDV